VKAKGFLVILNKDANSTLSDRLFDTLSHLYYSKNWIDRMVVKKNHKKNLDFTCHNSVIVVFSHPNLLFSLNNLK